jgi:glyoxylase-like metal-dependent hydrolase (beta-lactamase superfamily II)
MISDTDARILAGEWPVAGKRRGSWPNVRADFSLLAAEQRVGNLEVIPTPGHSPGHISLRDTRDGTIIAGDAFTAIGGLAVPSHLYWRFPLAATATWDRGEAIRSAQVLRALAPSLLVVGHGPATFEPLAAMDAAIHRAERAA